MKSILKTIIDEIRYDELPHDWTSFDIRHFSSNKILYTFQENAIINIIIVLYLFFNIDKANHSKFYQRYINKGLTQYMSHHLDFNYSSFRYDLINLLQNYYHSEGKSILFENFINRAAFWMATGSGKTLIIIKLLEIIKTLISLGYIPKKDILILTHRDDLLEQIKNLIHEYNELELQRGFRIEFDNLREYDSIKREGKISLTGDLHVFYYRSDLLSDEQKEKIINFKNYENNGNWYLILDEAHKGDKEESKRQIIFSILSRNGFLFNFSASFIDPRDLITTAYNFNLERFITGGYGKHIFLLKEEVDVFIENEDDFNEREKQKIVLEMLVLQTYLKKVLRKLKNIQEMIYWEPMMLTLVNTVNLSKLREKPDLKLFFDELEKIGKGKVDEITFKEAKEELIRIKSSRLIYEDLKVKIDHEELKQITIKEILHFIYNAEVHSAIEVLTIPDKPQEGILKLKSSNKPFALIKIGNAINWIKNNLIGYEINENYEKRSIFKRIDESSEINILLGSRAFYEGWDSNRPNLILFINIGKGLTAKKFIIQAIGRGVRIEPLKNKRKRLQSLHKMNEDENLFNKIRDFIQPVETLFICGTCRENLKEVLLTLKAEEDKENRQKTTERITKPKLILNQKHYIKNKFIISELQFNDVKNYITALDDRILVIIYNLQLDTIQYLRKGLTYEERLNYFDFNEKTDKIPLMFLIRQIFNFFQERRPLLKSGVNKR